MNRVEHHNTRAAHGRLPLFGSSWMALFALLRENLVRGGLIPPQAKDSPETGSVGHPH